MLRKTVVNVIGGNPGIENMFTEAGFAVIKSLDAKCDLVCFTGGEDVTPFLYGEKILTLDGLMKTHCNPDRDLREIKVFHHYSGTPKIGICRGAQLLNVLSGGSMYQHVDNHLSNHPLEYISELKKKKNGQLERVYSLVDATSTHHQMMIAGPQADVVGVAGRSTTKYTETTKHNFPTPEKHMLDNEILYYWHTESLCFQPHPEYVDKSHPLRRVFFKLIEDWLQVGKETKVS